MKQKFIDMVPKMMKPWSQGSLGTPWSFTTIQLVNIGNNSLPPDSVLKKEGELVAIYLDAKDVIEAMEQLSFNRNFINDPIAGFVQAWEVELISNVIL